MKQYPVVRGNATLYVFAISQWHAEMIVNSWGIQQEVK